MYIGLDVHKKVCYGTLADEKGQILRREKFRNDPSGLRTFMRNIGEAEIAMEAGYCWQPLYDHLEKSGFKVRLVHPLKVKAIAEAKIKTDKIDSETITHLLRTDLLPESYVPPKEIRELRDLVRRRSFLVGFRTRIRNRVHAELVKRGVELGVPPFSIEGRGLLAGMGLDAIGQILPVMDAADVQVRCISRQLKRMSGGDERARLLMTIPGVGYYIALLLVSEIGDVRRFSSSERLCSYAGLVPSVRRSGDSDRRGGITKTGSRWMRWALTQAVHVHVRYESDLSGFYRRLAREKGSQKAVMATARKMLKVVYWMLLNGEPYRPFQGGVDLARA
jgi:transposase